MIVWKEQEPEAELSVKHLKLSIAHYFLKSLLQPFWYGLKPFLLISHILVDYLIYSSSSRLTGKKPIFLMLYLPKSKRKLGLNCL